MQGAFDPSDKGQGFKTIMSKCGKMNSALEAKLKPGDIIYWRAFDYETRRHWAMYVGNGKIVEASNSGLRKMSVNTYNSYRYVYKVYRISKAAAAGADEATVRAALAEMGGLSSYPTGTSEEEKIIEVENNTVPRNIKNDKLTIEKIVFNKVPILDVNLFNFGEAAGLALEDDSVIYIIRKNVANWYYTFRNITIVGLLIVLIYIGLRIALSTIGSDRAKYTKLFVNWLVSFIIVFFIHYYMLAVILVNESLVGIVKDAMDKDHKPQQVEVLRLVEESNPDTGETEQVLRTVRMEVSTETSLYNAIFEKAYELKASQGIAGTIMYMFLVYYLLKFLFVYFKRLLTINILALISPLIAISYAVDKIKDGKSQALGTWMREFGENVLIQFVHALLYFIFVSIAFDLVFNTDLVGAIVGFVFLNFMLKAENLLFRMFKFGGSTGSLKNLMDSTNEFEKRALAVRGFGGSATKLAEKGASKAASAVPAIQRTRAYKSAKAGAQNIRANINNSKVANATRNTLTNASNKIEDATNGLIKGKTFENNYAVPDSQVPDFAAQKTREAQRSARKTVWKSVKGSLNTGKKIVKNSAEFAFAIPQMVANPNLGFQNLVRTSLELKRLLENPDKIKIGKQYAGQKFTVKKGAKGLGRVALAFATVGTSEMAIGMYNVNKKNQKQVKQAQEKSMLANAYKQSLRLERGIIADMIEAGDIEQKYITMIKQGKDHTEVTKEMLGNINLKSSSEISKLATKIQEKLEDYGIEASKDEIENNINKTFLEAIGTVVLSSEITLEKQIEAEAEAINNEEKQKAEAVELVVHKNARGIHLNKLSKEDKKAILSSSTEADVLAKEKYEQFRESKNKTKNEKEDKKQRKELTANQAVSLSNYQLMYNDVYTESKKELSEEEALQKATEALTIESENLDVQLNKVENTLNEIEERIKAGTPERFDFQIQASLEKKKAEIQANKQMVDALVSVQTGKEKVDLIDEKVAKKILEAEENAKQETNAKLEDIGTVEDSKEEKEILSIEVIAEEMLKGMSREEFIEFTYRAWKQDNNIGDKQIRKEEIRNATEDYLSTSGNEELTTRSATDIIEMIKRDKGLLHNRTETEELVHNEAMEMADSVITGTARIKQEKQAKGITEDYFKVKQTEDMLNVAERIGEDARKTFENELYELQHLENIESNNARKQVVTKEKANKMVDKLIEHMESNEIANLILASVEKPGSYKKEILPVKYEHIRQKTEAIHRINTYTKEKVGKQVCNVQRLIDNILNMNQLQET